MRKNANTVMGNFDDNNNREDHAS